VFGDTVVRVGRTSHLSLVRTSCGISVGGVVCPVAGAVAGAVVCPVAETVAGAVVMMISRSKDGKKPEGNRGDDSCCWSHF